MLVQPLRPESQRFVDFLDGQSAIVDLANAVGEQALNPLAAPRVRLAVLAHQEGAQLLHELPPVPDAEEVHGQTGLGGPVQLEVGYDSTISFKITGC